MIQNISDVFGRTVRDKITGFTGVVTGYCLYIDGQEEVFNSFTQWVLKHDIL